MKAKGNGKIGVALAVLAAASLFLNAWKRPQQGAARKSEERDLLDENVRREKYGERLGTWEYTTLDEIERQNCRCYIEPARMEPYENWARAQDWNW